MKNWDRDRRNQFVLFLLLALVTLALACYMILTPTPSPKTFHPWIPGGARVVDVKKFNPKGIILITVSKEKLMATARESGSLPLVVVDENKHSATGGGASIQYYLPAGNGIYDHAIDYVSETELRLSWSARFDASKGIFYLSPRKSWFLIALLTLASIGCLVLSCFSFKKRAITYFR